MPISLKPIFATSGYENQPTAEDLNELIAAVNDALTEAGLLTQLADTGSSVATAVTALAAPVPSSLPSTTFSAFSYDASTFLGPVTATTLVLTANRLYAVPIRFEYEFVIDNVCTYVTSAAVGNVRMGLYEMAASGFPGALVRDGGQTSHNSLNERSVYMNADVLPAGVYYMALLPEGAPTVRAYTANTGALWGGKGDGVYGSHVYKADVTFGALPDPFPTTGLIIPSSAAPHLYVYRT